MKLKLLIYLLSLSSFALVQNSLSWYKMIEGAIDKYPITMHLHKAGHNYYGYYYYNSQQKPIYFNGEDTSFGNNINLAAFSSNESAENFSFISNKNKVSGKWKKDEKSPELTFIGNEVSPL